MGKSKRKPNGISYTFGAIEGPAPQIPALSETGLILTHTGVHHVCARRHMARHDEAHETALKKSVENPADRNVVFEIAFKPETGRGRGARMEAQDGAGPGADWEGPEEKRAATSGAPDGVQMEMTILPKWAPAARCR